MKNEDILMKTDDNNYELSGLIKITSIISIDQKYIVQNSLALKHQTSIFDCFEAFKFGVNGPSVDALSFLRYLYNILKMNKGSCGFGYEGE